MLPVPITVIIKCPLFAFPIDGKLAGLGGQTGPSGEAGRIAENGPSPPNARNLPVRRAAMAEDAQTCSGKPESPLLRWARRVGVAPARFELRRFSRAFKPKVYLGCKRRETSFSRTKGLVVLGD
jgi:hypothetical protein